MKTLLRIVLALLMIVALIVFIAYADGASLPVDHSVSVTANIPAPPEKVFALITNVAAGATWRPAVKSVKLLPPEAGPTGLQDHWTEDLGHGQTMTFLATRTVTPSRREVMLDDPNASYGGTWIYELSPSPIPNQTTLHVTEAGFIHSPLYRFMMAHIFGPTRNLDQYILDIRAAAQKP